MGLRIVALMGLFALGPGWLEAQGADAPIPQSPQARMKPSRGSVLERKVTSRCLRSGRQEEPALGPPGARGRLG